MKKLLLLALSFGLLASCSKDDKNGIPPVDPNKPQPENPKDKPATALEAKDLKVADYESYRDKKEKVKLHGEIAEVTNGRSYFKFSDGTLVQIFTHEKNLKEETTKKLKIVGQELTVVGVFTDYKLKDGSIVKEILYESEADLTFGKTPEVKPEQPVVTLKASTATVNDYQAGKTVKLHGNIVIEGNKSYFKFSDNTLIQIYASKKVFDALTDEAKTKLKTADQELTVVGTFTDFKAKDGSIVKEIVYEKEADLTFGKTPEAKPEPKPEQPVVTLEASTATVNDFQEEKVVKVHGTITIQVENKHKRSYFKFSDGTLIQFYVRDYEKTLSQEVRTKLETEGQEVTVKGTFKTYTKTDKKTGTKTDIRQIVYESAADLTF